jgi:hypothetical protein
MVTLARMKLYTSRDLVGQWVGEDKRGGLVTWPARDGGWADRTPFTGKRAQLEEVEPALARGTGWPGGGRGPRPRSGGEASNERLTLRATQAEIQAWQRRASALNKPLSTWGRDTLNAAAGADDPPQPKPAGAPSRPKR